MFCRVLKARLSKPQSGPDNRTGHFLLFLIWWLEQFETNAMNVSLTPELEKLVTLKVESGLYQSASEVIREGLRLLDDHDRLRALQLNEVRKKIRTGLDQLDRGEGMTGDQTCARMKQRSAEFRKPRK
jgi:antitoxin ParD1/3/4